MPLEARLRKRLVRELDEGATPAAARLSTSLGAGMRLSGDAERLWCRVGVLLRMELVDSPQDVDALELSCFALHLPLMDATGGAGRMNLRRRAESASELLVSVLGEEVEESLLERTTRLLQELPQASPALEEAKLLADAVNLEDLGLTGLIQQAVQAARQGGGVRELAEGWKKREQYGYWEARLKEGFHFEALRQMAKRRLEHARRAAGWLTGELGEDGA